jgi:hypothetical protein
MNVTIADIATTATDVTGTVYLEISQDGTTKKVPRDVLLGAARRLTLNEQTDSYTLVLTDGDGKRIDMNKATANNLTVPPNADVALPVGTTILIKQKGAGQTTVVAGSGVTVNKHAGLTLKLTGQHSVATLMKDDTNVWTLAGDLEAA